MQKNLENYLVFFWQLLLYMKYIHYLKGIKHTKKAILNLVKINMWKYDFASKNLFQKLWKDEVK